MKRPVKLTPEEFQSIAEGIDEVMADPQAKENPIFQDFFKVVQSHRALAIELNVLEAKWQKIVVAPVLAHPHKRWDRCPYAEHDDNCICQGVPQ